MAFKYAFDVVRQLRGIVSGAAVLVGAMLMGPSSVHAEALFRDDFSSGDFSKHNDYFRWGGSGSIPRPGDSFGGMLDLVPGPHGTQVRAVRFRYGPTTAWQELRFHLTTSVSEARSESGTSNTFYPETWFSYWLYVPANYVHNGSNNKGFVTIWKNLYQTPPSGQIGAPNWSIDFVQAENGLSYTRAWWATRTQYPNSIADDHRGAALSDGTYAYTYLPSDLGRWVHIAVGCRLDSSTAVNDGYIKYFKDGRLIAQWNSARLDPLGIGIPGRGVDRGYIMGYHNSAYSATTTFYVTDFRFGTTEADVRMVDSSSTPKPPSSVTAD